MFGLRLWIRAVVDARLCFAPLLPFPSSTSTCHCFVLLHCVMQHTVTRCVIVSICAFSLALFLSPHTHTRTHTHTHCDMDLTSAFVSLLLLLLLLLLSLWCAQPGYQQHWGRRSSGACRGAEEQRHAAGAVVSAVCADLEWWMRLCLWCWCG